MEILIMGLRKVDFKGKDGNPVKGVNVYFAYKDEDHVEGSACDRMFLSPEKFQDFKIKVGAKYDAYYNRFGKIDSMRVL